MKKISIYLCMIVMLVGLLSACGTKTTTTSPGVSAEPSVMPSANVTPTATTSPGTETNFEPASPTLSPASSSKT